MTEAELRQSLLAHCREMNEGGLSRGTSGNLSVRCGDGFLITPSGVPYTQLTPESLVLMQFDGSWAGPLGPSSEWRFHRDLLTTRPEMNAVVHAHPPYATTLSIKRLEIPSLHYMIAAVGGNNIRCAEYATFGSEELSHAALAAMAGRSACLLANHGMLAAGPDLVRAMWIAFEVETLARHYYQTLLIGGPVLLDDAEIARNVEKFKGYGPGAKG